MLGRMRAPYFFICLVVVFVGIPSLQAQIHGVPASVTSFGFGGSTSRTPGVAASVTSLGPRGFGGSRFGGNTNFTHVNPFFRDGSRSRGLVRGRRRHVFFPVGVPVYGYPYAYAETYDDEDYEGGPTIFDRRGSGYGQPRDRIVERDPEPAPQQAVTAAPSEPVVPQPSTLLVFRDGHQSELQNYAIVGDTLFDLTDNRTHKILLADLDLPATRKANEARGVDFQVPASSTR